MPTLLIDNYDSYTFNLFHLLGEATGEEPIVVRNDAGSWEDLVHAHRFDRVVISPGPGRPERRRDSGVSLAAIAQGTVPVLGVCLGHQALAHVFGGRVDHAPEVMHGRLSPVHHDGSGLFAGLPNPFMAVRYHSLVVAAVPPALRVTARSDDGVVMGLEHRERPLWGVQFHPESVCTEDGRRLIENFLSLSDDGRIHRAGPGRRPTPIADPGSSAAVTVHHRRLGAWCDPAVVFDTRYADHGHVAWLDSSRAEPGLARFSFIAAPDGPLGRIVEADAAGGTVSSAPPGGASETRSGGVLDHCARELAGMRADAPKLPFDFVGGFVGYFGYEIWRECGAATTRASELPDAGLLFCDRVIAFDHDERRVHLLALADPPGATAAETWLDTTAAALHDLAAGTPAPGTPAAGTSAPGEPREPAGRAPLPLTLRDDKAAYVASIGECLEAIHEGETYEVCLTTELRGPGPVDPLVAYAALRVGNPAPHAALLRLGPVSVLSSSPERFLRVDRDGVVESRPIKGTAARSPDPGQDALIARSLQADDKARAENLMIADLVRNDLGRVSALGSVHVPALMVVETYATVHQLVSVVRGRLRPGLTAVDAVRAAFPAGSMTGAPKLRTMEIIDRLEARARGVYAGALGYLSVNGTADLSVVIRTIVVDPAGLSIGSGGAIVAASDPEAEFEEMLLKARPLLDAVGGVLAPARVSAAGPAP